MPGAEGFKSLEAQPVAPKGAVEQKDVAANRIANDTEEGVLQMLQKIKG